MTPAVELKAVTLSYGAFVAIKGVDLSVEKGSFVTLLGPSGCGKTTILRSIAGLVTPDSGEILIAGRRINEVPIYRRNIGLVFQNYALFPHKSIFDNVAFGLKYRKVPKPEIAQRVKAALETVRLPGVEAKLPSQLSGGQQQRIALARAIVIEPDVLLLDEPLSALDANLREEMRSELKQIQRKVGITTIFVTHDQEEALALSDRIVVMNHGLIEQNDGPEAVYRRPASRFVATFLGQSNLLAGRVKSVSEGGASVALDGGPEIETPGAGQLSPDDAVTIVVRAQRIGVGREGGGERNRLEGRIATMSYLGGTAVYMVDCGGGIRLQAIAMIGSEFFREGDEVVASFAPGDCVLLDAEGRRIG